MTKRLSNDWLRGVLDGSVEVEINDVFRLANALLELLALRAAGPVMPETPSEAVMAAIRDGYLSVSEESGDESVYYAIRDALISEIKPSI